MNMTKKWVLTAMVLPLTLGSASVFAYGGGKGKPNHDGLCGMHHERTMARELQLTPEQQSQINALREQHRQIMQEKRTSGPRDAMRSLREQERQLMLAADFDQAAATELAKQMVDIHIEHRVDRIKNRHQMMSILTDEQKDKLQTLQQTCMDENWQQNPRANNDRPRGHHDGSRGKGRF
ncbi:CpxP family protein [Vibrio sp. V27_P1S3P104]|uniref:CpxP family protein n=1 Tax=unclassified Vibrio TaxID=2614977 RepID=UPI00137260A9|nr:CpxP family protein [Vibrio sp. V28_P6S34P95]NAX05951.1 CpxP family protein [Vibrio sp. V30_P3S12P165]NAX35582.1 CpxP family protein [Vibrio sp. V29_P1S30P107]NAX37772.1 CpxP family protein [Vibrio sp. V27_P1S3P104]NAX40651.1 CpxP family protein [Vibrio sp. V26_P1S5P106]